MLTESLAAGVSHFLVPATDSASFASTLELARNWENTYCALGIHPHSANEWNREVRDRIRGAMEENPKVVAIGEIGLDYHYDFAPRDVQRKAFAEQIELAIELHKPIVIHTRESEEDVFRIIEEHYSEAEGAAVGAHLSNGADTFLAGQFHCFSLGHEFLHRALSLGFYISYTGNITFKNSTLGDTVQETPLDRLLIETDSPYLAPAPYRGKRNSPAYLPFIAQKVAELKKSGDAEQDISVIMQHTFENALRLFRIALPVLFAMLMLTGVAVTASLAQHTEPAGLQPPDSLLTGDRRKAEELRKKQQEQLAREAEQHRIDSIKAEQQAMEETMAKAREQARQDSIRGAQRLAAEEQHAQFLQTLKPWKAIGVGFSAGVTNMQMAPLVLTSTSVFAYTFDASTELSHRLDFDLSYSHMVIGGDYSPDSIWNYGPGSGIASHYNPAKNFLPGKTRLITNETFAGDWLSADFRYVITKPDAVINFYLGMGYMYMVMTNTQQYFLMEDSIHHAGGQTYQKSFDRSAIKVLFGMRHDFEIGSGMTLEPFAQIATMAAFQGQQQENSFLLGPDPTLLIMTHFNMGFTLYYGWWGVKREE